VWTFVAEFHQENAASVPSSLDRLAGPARTPEAFLTVAGGRSAADTSGRAGRAGGTPERVPEAVTLHFLASLQDAVSPSPRDPGVSLADSLNPRLPSVTPSACGRQGRARAIRRGSQAAKRLAAAGISGPKRRLELD
jgi:hypothetical protein